MSPLIDVTNIVTNDDIHNESCIRINNCQSSNNDAKDVDHSLPTTTENQKNNDKGSINNKTSGDISKISSPTTVCKCSGTKPKLTNKNRRRNKQTNSDEKSKKTNSDETFYFPIKENKNDRVPPIEYDDNFFHSLKKLSISSNEKKSALETNCESECKSDKKICCNGSSNHKELLSESYSSTYQCIACRLELSSLENLTNHLVKHIYEGLHAASWLNHAMSILQIGNDTPSNSLPTQNVKQEQTSQIVVKENNNEKFNP